MTPWRRIMSLSSWSSSYGGRSVGTVLVVVVVVVVVIAAAVVIVLVANQ